MNRIEEAEEILLQIAVQIMHRNNHDIASAPLVQQLEYKRIDKYFKDHYYLTKRFHRDDVIEQTQTKERFIVIYQLHNRLEAINTKGENKVLDPTQFNKVK